MTSAPLFKPLTYNDLPAGGSLSQQTPYGTVSVRRVQPATPPNPALVGGVSSPINPITSPTLPVTPDPAGGGLVNGSPGPASPAGQAQGGGVDVAPASNSVQRWQQEALDRQQAQTDRFEARKESRFKQAGSAARRDFAAADEYRREQRITPGPDNIVGYGTPARPELNKGAIPQPQFNSMPKPPGFKASELLDEQNDYPGSTWDTW